jgi:hypothetical protein
MDNTLSPTEMIARELERFLEDKEPGVVCIRGRWGVGKTHTWSAALKAVKDREKLNLQVYSPVSLFGVTNLEQLKYAIFMNKQEGTGIGSPLGSTWGEALDKGLRATLDTLTGKAEQALQMFMSVHDTEDAAFFELDQHMFSQQIDDPGLRKAFAEKAVSLRKTPEPRDILIRFYKNGGWHQSDLEILANLSVEELYDLFKKSSGEDHRRLITSALQVLNPAVVEKAKLALKRIGGENKLNRARVAAYGVEIAEEIPTSMMARHSE